MKLEVIFQATVISAKAWLTEHNDKRLYHGIYIKGLLQEA